MVENALPPGQPIGLSQSSTSPTLDEIYARGIETWAMAKEIAMLLAVDPIGLGGVLIRGGQWDRQVSTWLAGLQDLMPDNSPMVTLPGHSSDGAILGSVSIDRSLAEGALVAEPGLLARANGGLLVARLAETLPTERAALIAGAMDTGKLRVERTGVSRQDHAAFALVLVESGGADDTETSPRALVERLAFTLSIAHVPARCVTPFDMDRADVAAARALCRAIPVADHLLDTMVKSCATLGIHAIRPALFWLRASRAYAALAGRASVTEADIEQAAPLVLAHRCMPVAEPPAPQDTEPPEQPPNKDELNDTSEEETHSLPDTALEDQLIAAVQSAALASALGSLTIETAPNNQAKARSGRSGASARKQDNGRPDRPTPRERKRDGRIDLMATLRTAAPFQPLRAGQRPGKAGLHLRPSDLRVKTYRHRRETSVIFLVDASGSSALNRMGEAKGAIEHLLSDCYSRRDHVALIAVRGAAPDLLLAPTRALTRVRRALAALPSGGTTPLAGGLLMASDLSAREARAGRTPFLVILSDGRGNVGLDGSTDKAIAEADLERAARQTALSTPKILFFDTSRRPSDRAMALASRLHASYRHMPYASANLISGAVQAGLKAP